MLDEVADVMIFDVGVFRIRGGHVVGGEGNAALVVLEVWGGNFDSRATKGRE